MTKEKGSLTFPSNPLARLQQLRAAVDTPMLDGVKEAPNEASTFQGQEASNEGITVSPRIDRLFPQAAKVPTSRLNAEIRDSLHSQLKQYCTVKKIPIRLLVEALIEDFLTAEGERDR